MENKKLFTSESVSQGHPDKLCDQISDAILDEMLRGYPMSRVACETVVTTGMALVVGEISTEIYVDIPNLVRKLILEVGYDNAHYGFDGNTCAILTSIDEQSADIAMGVDAAMEQKAGEAANALGAGDQGMMFGYACRETPELMPMPIVLAHRLCRKMDELRHTGQIPFLRPDGKSQVTIEYDEAGNPKRIDTVVVSSQHHHDVSQREIHDALTEKLIYANLPRDMMDEHTRIFVNPTGRFVVGGPQGDSGLTGRKIIVDTYGGAAPHGGGAFSGKDPTKVDRSACYAARHAAKNIVAAGLADRCQIQLAYAIGVARPVSIAIETFGTEKITKDKILELISTLFDFTPGGIIERFDLRRPIYRQTATYGHFGRDDLDLPWERCDMVDELKKRA